MTFSNYFNVRHQDKKRALAYYRQQSFDYENFVSWGPLSLLRNRERSAVLSVAELKHPAKTMIDLGCGGGFYSLYATHFHLQVTAVDASEPMLRALKSKVYKTILGDLESLEIKQKYDRVLCLGVLDFVISPDQAITKLCSLVANQGKLVILVPRVSWATWFYQMEKKMIGVNVNIYELNWLQNFVESQGLKLDAIRYPLPTNMVLAFSKITYNLT